LEVVSGSSPLGFSVWTNRLGHPLRSTAELRLECAAFQLLLLRSLLLFTNLLVAAFLPLPAVRHLPVHLRRLGRYRWPESSLCKLLLFLFSPSTGQRVFSVLSILVDPPRDRTLAACQAPGFVVHGPLRDVGLKSKLIRKCFAAPRLLLLLQLVRVKPVRDSKCLCRHRGWPLLKTRAAS